MRATGIGEIVDSCRVWKSHSDSNWVSTVNYDSEVGSQPSDSRTWERRKVVVDMKRREPDVGNRKDDSGLSALVDRLCQSRPEEARRRDRPPTGGQACLSGGKGGHEVDRPLQVKAVSPHLPGIWLPGGDNEPDRGKNKNQKLIEGPGNKQRSERVGQPLRPPGINAPLTQVGVSAEISYRSPIGGHRGKIGSGATGRPIVRSFRRWRRRGRPEMTRNQPVPVLQTGAGDRWANPSHLEACCWCLSLCFQGQGIH